MFEHWLYPGGQLAILGEIKAYPEWKTLLVALSTGAALGGIVLGWFFYGKKLPEREGWDLRRWSPFRRAAGQQFGYDKAMVDMSVEGGNQLATFSWKFLDSKGIDAIVNGVAGLAGQIGKLFGWAQTGFVRGYALLMLLGGVGLIGYLALVLFQSNGGPK